MKYIYTVLFLLLTTFVFAQKGKSLKQISTSSKSECFINQDGTQFTKTTVYEAVTQKDVRIVFNETLTGNQVYEYTYRSGVSKITGTIPSNLTTCEQWCNEDCSGGGGFDIEQEIITPANSGFRFLPTGANPANNIATIPAGTREILIYNITNSDLRITHSQGFQFVARRGTYQDDNEVTIVRSLVPFTGNLIIDYLGSVGNNINGNPVAVMVNFEVN